MSLNAGNVSRRAVLAAAGGLAATSALAAEAAIITPAHEAASRIQRISLVTPDVQSVADALQDFTGSASPRTRAEIEHAGVHTECFWIGDILIEISQAPLAGTHISHLIGLEMTSPDAVRARARAAGLRLARDMTIRGHRLIQPEFSTSDLRLEASTPLRLATASKLADSEVAITSIRIATDTPDHHARQTAALFGARHLAFVAPRAGDSRRGLIEITLSGPGLPAETARIAGVDWRIVA